MRKFKLLLFFLSKCSGLFRLAGWVTRNSLKILCYHGFSMEDEADFRQKLFIRPERFAQRLAAIRRQGYNVLPLDDAIERLYSRTLPKHALVITADDGFHSFHRLAVPLLRRYAFPATVYVTTYYVAHANPVFRLVVQYMFWKSRKRRLILRDVPWSANREIDLLDFAQTEQAIWQCINHGERECTEEMRCAICEKLGALLETPYEDIVRSKAFHLMSPDELKSLAAVKVDVQLHTHRHIFPSSDQSLACREINDNRNAIRQWIDAETRHFCYPSGLWEKCQWAWLDGMHVKSSTTCMPGFNSGKTPRHALHRFLDGDNIHQLEFEAELTGFADLLRGLYARIRGKKITQ